VLRRPGRARGEGGYVVQTASELELYLFRESFDEARAKRFHGLTPVSSYLRGLSHPPDEQGGRARSRPFATGMEGAGVPVETSKGEWGKGQEEINLRYAPAPRDGRSGTSSTSTGVKEIAWQQGSIDLHGESTT
jgi:glutamine synthetase